MFSLHPQLINDTIQIGDLPLSRVLLMNNAELPWLILVPRQENVSEWYALEANDQQQLHTESMGISRLMMSLFNGYKLNTGALGNIVPQFHLHHIVRYQHDSVWPHPVWGKIETFAYSEVEKSKIVSELTLALAQTIEGFSPP
jgi:diadenosine tetraphosphate (Ap4A) HIT family hydrolase